LSDPDRRRFRAGGLQLRYRLRPQLVEKLSLLRPGHFAQAIDQHPLERL
jgi:hypothetical protein